MRHRIQDNLQLGYFIVRIEQNPFYRNIRTFRKYMFHRKRTFQKRTFQRWYISFIENVHFIEKRTFQRWCILRKENIHFIEKRTFHKKTCILQKTYISQKNVHFIKSMHFKENVHFTLHRKSITWAEDYMVRTYIIVHNCP